jgi:acyl-CoA dehydrogenase
MDFEFTDEQLALRDGIRRLAASFPETYWAEKDEKREFPWEFHEAVAADGWLGICIPPEYGGGGLGVMEASIVAQEVAASGAGMNGASIVHTAMFGLLPLVKHGSEEIRQRFLPRAAKGDLHLAFTVTEPNAGTDTSKTATFARKVPGGYLVNGQKVWITKAQEAERLLMLTRTTTIDQVEKKTHGMTLFFAPCDRDHIEIRPIKKMGRNATDSNELFIDDLFVPDEDVIGEPGRGFYYLLDGLNPERILNAQEAIGLGRASIRRAVD